MDRVLGSLTRHMVAGRPGDYDAIESLVAKDELLSRKLAEHLDTNGQPT